MIGLLDANNFYVSCERSFDARLDNKPVIVLSNGDSCVVARSNEAKALGIKMGVPIFEIRELVEQHQVQVFSSNYALYGDLSARIFTTVGRFVENIEVYSIDEAFLDLDGYESVYPDLRALGNQIRATVLQWQRIPTSLGIGPTKTLAKVANWFAKRHPEYNGVCILDTPESIEEALQKLSIEDLWGVGWRYEGMLKRFDIKTAAAFRDLPDDWIRERMTVNGLRMAYELRGVRCKLLELEAPNHRSMCVAPSFNGLAADLPTLTKALLTHLSRLGEKLRKEGQAAGTVTVFIHTSRFRRNALGELGKQYSASRSVNLPHPTASTAELIGFAQAALTAIFKFGYEYKRLGVMLTNLVPEEHQQGTLFTEAPDPRLKQLSKAIDGINNRYGRDKVRYAAVGYETGWQTRRQWLSPRYTTNWAEIMTVR